MNTATLKARIEAWIAKSNDGTYTQTEMAMGWGLDEANELITEALKVIAERNSHVSLDDTNTEVGR